MGARWHAYMPERQKVDHNSSPHSHKPQSTSIYVACGPASVSLLFQGAFEVGREVSPLKSEGWSWALQHSHWARVFFFLTAPSAVYLTYSGITLKCLAADRQTAQGPDAPVRDRTTQRPRSKAPLARFRKRHTL
jgi:hypothetical protein